MRTLQPLFENNREWASKIKKDDPEFFSKLSKQQSPQYLWIGCSDSRVPANQIVNLLPGELFVHRNIANVVVHTDLNCLSVLQFAVDVLKVKHVIVCGHYSCGGVNAAFKENRLGLCDNWIRHIRDITEKHTGLLSSILDNHQKGDKLCELNVIEQVKNVCETTIVQNAWLSGEDLSVHGWIYSINDGLLKDLNLCITNQNEMLSIYNDAVKRIYGDYKI